MKTSATTAGRSCPTIESPCPTLPSFAPGQKVAFCALCRKNVHNLSALADGEQRELLTSHKELCVRYALIIPALLLGTATPVFAQDSDEPSVREAVTVTGGRVRHVETLFESSEIEEPLDEEPVQEPKS